MSSFWSPRMLRLFALGVWIALALSVAIGVRHDTDRSTMLTRGDMPGFYAPAVILARGQQAALYNRELQRDVENEFWPSMHGRYLMSVYPPYVAALSYPLSWFSPLAAKGALALICLAALLLTIKLTGGLLPQAGPDLLEQSAFALLFTPLFVSIVGGQNTMISLLLLVLAARFIALGSRDILAGMMLGLLLYKPQFGLLAVAPFALIGRWRIVLGAGIVAIAYYAIGAAVLGFDWPIAWRTAVQSFAPDNFAVNADRMVSLAALGHTAAPDGDTGRTMQTITLCLALAAYGAGAKILIWNRRGDPGRLAEGLLAFGAVIVLVSPQSLFYDLGIAAVALPALAHAAGTRAVTGYVVLCGIAALLFWVMTVFHLPAPALLAIFLAWAAVKKGAQTTLLAPRVV